MTAYSRKVSENVSMLSHLCFKSQFQPLTNPVIACSITSQLSKYGSAFKLWDKIVLPLPVSSDPLFSAGFTSRISCNKMLFKYNFHGLPIIYV